MTQPAIQCSVNFTLEQELNTFFATSSKKIYTLYHEAHLHYIHFWNGTLGFWHVDPCWGNHFCSVNIRLKDRFWRAETVAMR